jgi:hypothetical protein
MKVKRLIGLIGVIAALAALAAGVLPAAAVADPGTSVALVVAGAAAGASQAAAPVQLKDVDISDSFTIPAGDLCAFDVTVTTTGTADVTLWLNDSGLVVREHDTAPGSTMTFSGNGNSFSFPNAFSIETDYGSGATLGGSATVTISGMTGHAPGYIASDAGHQIIVDETVVGFRSVDGAEIPITDGGNVQVQHGSFHSNDEIAAAICAALS